MSVRAKLWGTLGLLVFAWGFARGGEPPLCRELTPVPIRVLLGSLPPPYHTPSARKFVQIVSPPKEARLSLPAGFRCELVAEGFDSPRWLAEGPEGTLFVADSYADQIWLLEFPKGGGPGARRRLFGTATNGLRLPFGMAWDSGSFYVACTDRLLRFPYKPGQTALKGEGKVLARYPGGGHWTRSLAFAPDGRTLFVGIGSWGNVGWEEPPRATVLQVAVDGSFQKVWVRGTRNPVGLALHPGTHELWCVVNERDGLGDELVPDYLACLHAGEFYGWPAAYLTPRLRDPRIRARSPLLLSLVSRTKTPEVLFQAHSAPLGLAFGRPESGFPLRYQQGAFVAFHGSWNRSRATGYKIVFVPFDGSGKPLGWYEDFLTGFLVNPDPPQAWGRPTGLVFLANRGLFFSEDALGRVYRVYYQGVSNR